MKLKPRVLVIDDSHNNVQVLTEFLELNNIKVIGTGYNGKTAFELYKKLEPDAVVLGLMLDEYDGIYGLEKIREFDHKAKVILVTESTAIDKKNMLENLGASAIVCKSFDIDNIPETIDKLCENDIPASGN